MLFFLFSLFSFLSLYSSHSEYIVIPLDSDCSLTDTVKEHWEKNNTEYYENNQVH